MTSQDEATGGRVGAGRGGNWPLPKSARTTSRSGLTLRRTSLQREGLELTVWTGALGLLEGRFPSSSSRNRSENMGAAASCRLLMKFHRRILMANSYWPFTSLLSVSGSWGRTMDTKSIKSNADDHSFSSRVNSATLS